MCSLQRGHHTAHAASEAVAVLKVGLFLCQCLSALWAIQTTRGARAVRGGCSPTGGLCFVSTVGVFCANACWPFGPSRPHGARGVRGGRWAWREQRGAHRACSRSIFLLPACPQSQEHTHTHTHQTVHSHPQGCPLPPAAPAQPRHQTSLQQAIPGFRHSSVGHSMSVLGGGALPLNEGSEEGEEGGMQAAAEGSSHRSRCGAVGWPCFWP